MKSCAAQHACQAAEQAALQIILAHKAECSHVGGQAWEHGGYSDDLIVAAQCSHHGLRILCPAFALFPQWCACPSLHAPAGGWPAPVLAATRARWCSRAGCM